MRFQLPIETDWVWEPSTVDFAAVVTFVLLLVFSACWLLAMPTLGLTRSLMGIWERLRGRAGPVPESREFRQRVQRGFVALGGAVIATLGLYVGYATFRASNMIGALQYISDQGNNISSMETGTPQVLCVYRWGEASPSESRAIARQRHRQGCGPEIFVNRDTGRLAESFDDIQLYIEETILFAVESNIYNDRYGADFYRGLEYWIEDFSEDDTGAISYYIVSREIDDAEDDVEGGEVSRNFVDGRSLACLHQYTGIQIENICQRYRDFVGEELRGVVSSRLEPATSIRCDVPQDYTSLLSESPTYSCNGSYWGEYFRGMGEGRQRRLRPQ